MPSSAQVFRMSPSTSRLNSEYSDCSAAMGCTAYARRSVAALASDNPRKRTLPSCTSSANAATRSEEHTSELQSPDHLVCRLLLEKKKQPRTTLRALHLMLCVFFF